MSEVYYEVHMTRVLHTAGISNVDGVMFVDRNKSKLFRNLLPTILIHFKYALYLGALIMQIIMCMFVKFYQTDEILSSSPLRVSGIWLVSRLPMA